MDFLSLLARSQPSIPRIDGSETSIDNRASADPWASNDDIPQSLSLDDRNLFQNFNRFLHGSLGQREFQERFCKRLLFTWEWVFALCFNNFNSALQTWYDLLGEGGERDIWLWADGDEECCPTHCLVAHSKKHGSTSNMLMTDLDTTYALSNDQLGHAISLLRLRLCSKSTSPPALSLRGKNGFSQPEWRQRLELYNNVHLRCTATVLVMARSDAIQLLDRGRRIKGRAVQSLVRELELQFGSSRGPVSISKWEQHLNNLERLGHSCKDSFLSGFVPPYGVHLVIEVLRILDPHHQLSKPVQCNTTGNCLKCQGERPLLVDDISPRKPQESEENLSLNTLFSPKPYLRLLWWMWAVHSPDDPQVDKWLSWVNLLASRPTALHDKYYLSAPRGKIIMTLLSKETEETIRSGDFIPRYVNQFCFEGGTFLGDLSPGSLEYVMYVPTTANWTEAESICDSESWSLRLQLRDPLEIRTTLSLLAYWMTIRGVTDDMPDIHTFLKVLVAKKELHRIWFRRATIHAHPKFAPIKRRLLEGRPKCCREIPAWILDWYLTTASILSESPNLALTAAHVWRCSRHKVSRIDVKSTLRAYLSTARGGSEDADLLYELVNTAGEYGLGISSRGGMEEVSDANNEDREYDVLKDPAIAEETRSSHTSLPRQPEQPLFDSKPRSPPPIQTKNDPISKSAQVQAVKSRFIALLHELQSLTTQIPALIPRGKQKESLPWKALTEILNERGYELENWPSEVPLPGSGSKLCDDNKGIHGLNAAHLRLLYNATRDEAHPLRFRKMDIPKRNGQYEDRREHKGVRRIRDRELDNEQWQQGEEGTNKRRRMGEGRSSPAWARQLWD